MAKSRRATFDWSMIVIVAIVVVAAVAVYMRDGADAFLEILRGDLGLFVDVLPKVLAGCLIGAFVTLLLPREAVTRWVGAESGLTGLIIATLAGIVLPGGPLAIYPVASAFLVAGADIGAVVALLTSWTLIGFNRALIWEVPFMGVDFVLWRMLAALPFPVIAGVLGRYAAKALLGRPEDAA
jgi:uncharacterized membrane protein YraQ (UPF0718 family)